MGSCVGSQAPPQQISMQAKRLKHEIGSTIEKIRGQTLVQQKALVSQFKKEKPFRAQAAQMSIANQITMNINKMQIYEVVRCHIQKIIDYNHHLEKPQQVKQSLYNTFKQILYCQSILKDKNIDNLCLSLKKRYPQLTEASDEQVDSNLMRHHKRNQLPTPSMTNQYLLKLINQENLSIQEVNKIGHKIRYGL